MFGMLALCIDALNIQRKLLPNPNNVDPDQWLVQAKKCVATFVQAARKSNYEPIVFIDAAIQTEEAIRKWIQRREKEVKRGERNVLQGLSILLGDMFSQSGVAVHYSSIDCDDTIASYASAFQAPVLSADRDFFRYVGNGTPLKIFCNFAIRKGRLHLIRHPREIQCAKPGVKSREILHPLPQTYGRVCTRERLLSERRYIRGVTSSLIQKFPNIHTTARPLRQALYARLGITQVEEKFPEWARENEDVYWSNDIVLADAKFDELLDNPHDAWRHLFAHETQPNGSSRLQWLQHVFSQRAVCFELCLLAQRDTESSLYNYLLNF